MHHALIVTASFTRLTTRCRTLCFPKHVITGEIGELVPKMFRPIRLYPDLRWIPLRLFSQQPASKIAKTETDLPDFRKQKDEIATTTRKTDNFLIEFNKRKPTYDQLFEYTIDSKLHDTPKFKDNSFISADFKLFMHKKYEISFDAIRRFIKNLLIRYQTESQAYSVKRHGTLGPDLATANFIVSRGGRVRFKHKPDVWITDLKGFPKFYDKKYRVISVDAANITLVYSGLDNLILLHDLEELHLCNNPQLDDFACDKLARLFRNSQCLSYLDLSHIPSITHRGIEALHKIPSLQTLVIKGTKAAQYPFIELLILMFNEVNPRCKIVYE